MAIDLNELTQALGTLSTQNPAAVATLLAKAFGISAESLADIVRVGAQAKTRDHARAILEAIRAEAAGLQSAEREAIEAKRAEVIAPIESAYQSTINRHAGIIARIEAIVAEAEAGRPVELPSMKDLSAELKGN